MENNNDNISKILDEVHKNSDKISKCLSKDELIYEGEYSINKSEAYEGLKNSGMIKTVGVRTIVYTIILVLAIICFIVAYIFKDSSTDLACAVFSTIVLAIILIIPKYSLNKLAKLNANGNLIKFLVYNNSLQILCNENSWYIKLNNSNRMKICKNVLIIKRSKDNQLFVIPLRAINEDKKEEVITVLKKGTLSY
ncbi:MAG: hypothetical protein UE295_05810 [Acutalibacteraceae bacterium]|nr:hypothetical protein [Acutalibacteraceae bacterium]